MAFNIISLLNGGQQQAVRDSYAETAGRDVTDAQRAIGVASNRTGMNPAAAARQYNVSQERALAQRAEARRSALAQAKVADDSQLSNMIAGGLQAAAQVGGTMMGGPAAGQAAGGVGSALTSALQPQTAPQGGMGRALSDPSGGGAPSGPSPANAFQGFAAGMPGLQFLAPGIQGGPQAPPNAQTGSSPSPVPQAAPGALQERDGMGRASQVALGGSGVQSGPPPQPAPEPARSALSQAVGPRPVSRRPAPRPAPQPSPQSPPSPPAPAPTTSAPMSLGAPRFPSPTLAGPTSEERTAAANRADFNERMMRFHRGR